VRKLEPCHGPPAAPSPSPPHCRAGNELEPPAVFRVAASGSRFWHPWPAPVDHLDPDNVVHRLDRDRDRLAGSTRAAMPQAIGESSPTSKAATSPHGRPGPSTPSTNARASLARSARPASVTVSRTARPAISSPAFPAASSPGNRAGWRRTHADARPTRRQTSSQGTPRNGHRNPVKRLPTPLPGPDSRPPCVRGHRNTTPYSATG